MMNVSTIQAAPELTAEKYAIPPILYSGNKKSI